MNSDQMLIKSAYENAIAGLYAELFQGYAEAAGNAEKQREAEQRFMAGVGLARSARDRAIALLA